MIETGDSVIETIQVSIYTTNQSDTGVYSIDLSTIDISDDRTLSQQNLILSVNDPCDDQLIRLANLDEDTFSYTLGEGAIVINLQGQ